MTFLLCKQKNIFSGAHLIEFQLYHSHSNREEKKKKVQERVRVGKEIPIYFHALNLENRIVILGVLVKKGMQIRNK